MMMVTMLELLLLLLQQATLPMSLHFMLLGYVLL